VLAVVDDVDAKADLFANYIRDGFTYQRVKRGAVVRIARILGMQRAQKLAWTWQTSTMGR
jgi:hypothetical protein